MSLQQERTHSARRPAREPRRPDFIVRAPDPNRRGKWLTLGAAWERDTGGYNVKLNTVPVGNAWDGALVLLPPIEETETRTDDFGTDDHQD